MCSLFILFFHRHLCSWLPPTRTARADMAEARPCPAPTRPPSVPRAARRPPAWPPVPWVQVLSRSPRTMRVTKVTSPPRRLRTLWARAEAGATCQVAEDLPPRSCPAAEDPAVRTDDLLSRIRCRDRPSAPASTIPPAWPLAATRGWPCPPPALASMEDPTRRTTRIPIPASGWTTRRSTLHW